MKREDVAGGLSLDPRPAKKQRMDERLTGLLTSFGGLWSPKSQRQEDAPAVSSAQDPTPPSSNSSSQATPIASTASSSQQTLEQPNSIPDVLSPAHANTSTVSSKQPTPSSSGSASPYFSGGIFASNRHSGNKLKTDKRLNQLREDDKQARARLQSEYHRSGPSSSLGGLSHSAEMAEYRDMVMRASKVVSALSKPRRTLEPAAKRGQHPVSSKRLEAVLNNASLSRKAYPAHDLESKALEGLQRQRLREAAKAKTVLTRRRTFPQALPDDIQEQVRKFFKQKDFASQLPGARVEAKDLKRLQPSTWLNDEIITFYVTMMNRRSADVLAAREKGKAVKYKPGQEPLNTFAFTSFFYPKYAKEGYKNIKRWTKKHDVFTKDAVLIPINLNNSHWVCAVINFRKKRFEYYDSMNTWNQDIVDTLRQWLVDEYREKKGGELDLSEWTDYQDPETPQQHNAFDCGMFICMTLEACSRKDAPLDYAQANMPYLRQKMVWEIHTQKFMDEEWS